MENLRFNDTSVYFPHVITESIASLPIHVHSYVVMFVGGSDILVVIDGKQRRLLAIKICTSFYPSQFH